MFAYVCASTCAFISISENQPLSSWILNLFSISLKCQIGCHDFHLKKLKPFEGMSGIKP